MDWDRDRTRNETVGFRGVVQTSKDKDDCLVRESFGRTLLFVIIPEKDKSHFISFFY